MSYNRRSLSASASFGAVSCAVSTRTTSQSNPASRSASDHQFGVPRIGVEMQNARLVCHGGSGQVRSLKRSAWWGFVHNGPKRAELADGVDEGAKVDRLHDVRIRAELVAADQILFLARRCQHDDGDRLQRIVRFQGAQHVETVDFRHLQIQEENSWVPGCAARVRIAPVQIVERLGAVAHDDNFVREIDLFESGERQLDVVRIVFGEDDALQLSHHDVLPPQATARSSER